MEWSCLAVLTALSFVSAHREVATIEKDVQVMDRTYRCTFKLVYDKEEATVDEATSTVACSPQIPYSHIPVNNVELDSGQQTFTVDFQMNPDEIIRGECGKNWEKHGGKDCYEGQGGTPMQPDPYSNSLSLSQCQDACVRNNGCVGIVRKESDGTGSGICYLRKAITLEECANDNTWATYKVSDITTTTGTTTKRPPSPPTDGFKKNSGTDCYEGVGGDPIQPDPYDNALTLSACKEACQQNQRCQGIIRRVSDQDGNGVCYLRTNLQLEQCVVDATWDLYQKRGDGSTGSCQHADKDHNCGSWKDEYCTDLEWADWMAKNCAKTCKCIAAPPVFSCNFLSDTLNTDGATVAPYTCNVNEDSIVDPTTGIFSVTTAGKYRLTFMSRMIAINKKKVVALMVLTRGGAETNIGRSTAQNKNGDSELQVTTHIDIIYELGVGDKIHIKVTLPDGEIRGDNNLAPQVVFAGNWLRT